MTETPEQRDVERIGRVVKDRYRILACVGVGGQGTVYRAIDLSTRAAVAIKILHRTDAPDPVAKERLVREAQAMMALAGTAAVRVLDQTFTEDGEFCLVTELLEGETLDVVLERLQQGRLALPVQELRLLFRPLVDTLEKAHALGIVHRDLKPENVFLHQAGGVLEPKLIDFGFAKFTKLPKLTSVGFVAGSPSYVAPELWLDREVTTRADVYALSAMMYRVLAGETPFPYTQLVELFRDVTTGPRPSLHARRPDLHPSVDAWVERALAIDPQKRFATPRETWLALCQALGLKP